MSYTHGSNLQRFKSYEFLKYSKYFKGKRSIVCLLRAVLLNVQLQIGRSALKHIVRSVFRLLGCIF